MPAKYKYTGRTWEGLDEFDILDVPMSVVPVPFNAHHKSTDKWLILVEHPDIPGQHAELVE